MARRQAGLQLKNRLTSSDDTVKAQVQQRWMQLPPDVRAYVKNNVLGALGSEGYRPSAAAQCVHYIGVVEIPTREWQDLVSEQLHFIKGLFI